MSDARYELQNDSKIGFVWCSVHSKDSIIGIPSGTFQNLFCYQFTARSDYYVCCKNGSAVLRKIAKVSLTQMSFSDKLSTKFSRRVNLWTNRSSFIDGHGY